VDNDIASDTIIFKVEKPGLSFIEEEDADTNESEIELPARLDLYLLSRLPGLSRSRIQQLIEEKKVLVTESHSSQGRNLKAAKKLQW
jgi:hypothetical protein